MNTYFHSVAQLVVLLLVFSTECNADGLSFSMALQVADSASPQLRARRIAISGAEEVVSVSDELPDPKIVFGMSNFPLDGVDNFSKNRDIKIGIMQNFPSKSKRRAQAELATAQVSEAAVLLQMERVNVRIETASAWLNRYYLGRQLVLFSDLDKENLLLADIVRAQLATGRSKAIDALLSRQETILLNNRRDDLQRDIAKADADLQRWLGDDGKQELMGDPPRFLVNGSELRQHVRHHPEVLLLQPQTAQALAELHKAEALRRPDWGVELAYQDRGSAYSNVLSFQVSIDMPLFATTRQNPVIRSRQQALNGIEIERESILREHQAVLESGIADYTALTQQLSRLQNDEIPLTMERVDLLTAAYRSGRSDITQVLQARRELNDIRLRAIMLENTQQVLAARLNFLFENNEEVSP